MTRVLHIAEDERSLMKMYAKTSTDKGWEVHLAENGAELIDNLKRDTRPALLLIDVCMPETDGIEVIDMLSEVEQDIRIRFMADSFDGAAIAAKLIAEARGFSVGRLVFKPTLYEDLAEILDEEAKVLSSLYTIQDRTG